MRFHQRGNTSSGTISSAATGALGGSVMPDPDNPVIREMERRKLASRRRASGRLSTVLSAELRDRLGA